MGSGSMSRDQTQAPALRGRSLGHQPTREASVSLFSKGIRTTAVCWLSAVYKHCVVTSPPWTGFFRVTLGGEFVLTFQVRKLRVITRWVSFPRVTSTETQVLEKGISALPVLLNAGQVSRRFTIWATREANGNILWFSNLGSSRSFSLSWTRASVVDLKIMVFYLPCLLLFQSFQWFYIHLFLIL